MATAELEILGISAADARNHARELDRELEQLVVQAHAANVSVGEIVRKAQISRGRAYAILRRHGVTVESDAGRALVQHRWGKAKEKAPRTEAMSRVDPIEAMKRAYEATVMAEQRAQAQAVPLEQPAERAIPEEEVEHIGVLEMLEKLRLERLERGEID
jgi:hypothetical protein